jgi:AraC-like DNA-binding protein
MLLCTIFAAIAWYSLMVYLISSGEIRHYPDLYNKGNPLYYLFAPCSYLYVRLSLSGRNQFHKNDWIHLILPLLAFIDIVPYMFKSPDEKQHIVDLIAADPHWNMYYPYAFITQADHYIVRSMQMAFYLIFQWRVLVKYKAAAAFKAQQKWFYFYNAVVTLTALVVMAGLTRALYESPRAMFEGILPVMVSAGIFLLGISFFLRPEQLYGTAFHSGHGQLDVQDPAIDKASLSKTGNNSQSEPAETKEITLTEEQLTLYSRKLERKMLVQECFREKGMTAAKLAGKLNISPRYLSALLKQHYQLRFNDFINAYRIDFIKDKLDRGEWKNVTFDALAEDAGFTSRSTFYAAFKKKTGLTPATYISAKLNEKPEPDTGNTALAAASDTKQ